MKNVLVAALWMGKKWFGQKDYSPADVGFFNSLSNVLNAKQVSSDSAAKALGLAPNHGFGPVFMGRIIDQYLKEYEKLFPLDVIVKNSAVGGYFDLKTPVVTVFQDPYDTISKIMYHYGYALPKIEHYNACVDLQRRTGEKSVCNVAVSKFMQAYMKRIGVKCHKVINEGVDMQKFKPFGEKEALRRKWGISNDKKVGLAVIKFHPAKGWHILAELVQNFKDVFWVICFTEPVNDKARSENVKVFQTLPRDKMQELYNLSDFFILPTACESFGLSALEAAACNIPIITQKTGWAWKFWDKRLGYRIKEWEYGNYEEAVEKVLEDPKFFPRKVVEDKFSLQNWAKDWKELISSIE